ncbi:hypothetical protein K490DRAFT_17892, partial [Saccharata proteae CBS 121410]
DESDSVDELAADEQFTLAKPRNSKPRNSNRTRAVSRANPKSSTSTPRRGRPRKREARNESIIKRKEIHLESDGVIPPWSTLPYAILQQIFTYASAPLCDDDYNPTPNVNWLLNTARVCKLWAEPALTAMYRYPPLVAIDKPHKLLHLLQQTGHVNYNVKIQRLEFDVIKSLAYTWTGRGHFDIADLIPYVPQLSELNIVHPQDRPPFRPILQSGRWHYTQAIFTALRNSEIRLKSWTWNSNLHAKGQTLSWMGHIHQFDAFQRIEHLSLLNYHAHDPKHIEEQYDDGPYDDEDPVRTRRTDGQILADNLDLLPRLKSLSFESCPILGDDFFPKLKDGLQSLTITNCHEVTSENLLPFLLSRGTELKSLVLNHNRSLDISFLSYLKMACPHLQVLKMDLTYYSTMYTHDDSEPQYVDLIRETDVPTWPSTLQVIELVQLRKWTSEAAETFFASLINSADQLPDLRTLVLKAILNIGWRDRAGFRDKWIGRLQRVFLRKSKPPAAHLMSGRRYREWMGEVSPDEPILGKRLSHVAVPASRKPSGAETASPSKRGAVSDINTRSLRPRRGGRVSPIEEETSSVSEDESGGEQSIQGMCEIVDVRIDNLRPREEQFNENDFLDSERSGDEDYN